MPLPNPDWNALQWALDSDIGTAYEDALLEGRAVLRSLEAYGLNGAGATQDHRAPRGKKCYLFDGVDDRVALPGLVDVSGGGTVFVRCKVSSLTSSRMYAFANTDNQRIYIGMETTNDWFIQLADVVITNTTPATTDEVALTGAWDGAGNGFAYINGALVNQASGLNWGSQPNPGTNIGAYAREGEIPNASGFWNGLVYECIRYDRLLTALEIEYLYTRGVSGTDPGTANLVAQYNCNEENGTTAYDSSGQGNHGTITSATTGPDGGTFHVADDGVLVNEANEVGFSRLLNVSASVGSWSADTSWMGSRLYNGNFTATTYAVDVNASFAWGITLDDEPLPTQPWKGFSVGFQWSNSTTITVWQLGASTFETATLVSGDKVSIVRTGTTVSLQINDVEFATRTVTGDGHRDSFVSGQVPNTTQFIDTPTHYLGSLISIEDVIIPRDEATATVAQFDGLGEHFHAPEPLVPATGDFEVRIRFKTSGSLGNRDVMFAQYTDATANRWQINTYDNGNVQFGFDAATFNLFVPGLLINTWFDVTLNRTGDLFTLSLYKDGSLLGSDSGTQALTMLQVSTEVGNRTDVAEPWPGKMNWVEVDRVGTPYAAYYFTDGSGLTVTDSVGSNDGTLAESDGSTFWETSDSGNLDVLDGELQYSGSTPYPISVNSPVGTFDGVDDRVDVDFSSLSFPTNQATLLMRIKVETDPPLSGNQTGLAAINDSSSGTSTNYPWTDGEVYMGLLQSASTRLQFTPTQSLSQWHWLAVTTEPGADNYKVYISGIEQATATGNPSVTLDSSLNGFGRSVAGIHFLDGQISHVALYDSVLTPQQIQDVEDSGAVPAGSIADYTFSEAAGTTVHNAVANTNHGTVTNATLANFWANRSDTSRDHCIEYGGRYANLGEVSAQSSGGWGTSNWLSKDEISDGGFIEWMYHTENNPVMGVSDRTDASTVTYNNQTLAVQRFAEVLRFWPEGGTMTDVPGPLEDGDLFRFRKVGDDIIASQNGIDVFTHNAPGKPILRASITFNFQPSTGVLNATTNNITGTLSSLATGYNLWFVPGLLDGTAAADGQPITKLATHHGNPSSTLLYDNWAAPALAPLLLPAASPPGELLRNVAPIDQKYRSEDGLTSGSPDTWGNFTADRVDCGPSFFNAISMGLTIDIRTRIFGTNTIFITYQDSDNYIQCQLVNTDFRCELMIAGISHRLRAVLEANIRYNTVLDWDGVTWSGTINGETIGSGSGTAVSSTDNTTIIGSSNSAGTFQYDGEVLSIKYTANAVLTLDYDFSDGSGTILTDQSGLDNDGNVLNLQQSFWGSGYLDGTAFADGDNLVFNTPAALVGQDLTDAIAYIGRAVVSVPVNTVLPAITGDPQPNLDLVCSTGTWDIPVTLYTYQWYSATTVGITYGALATNDWVDFGDTAALKPTGDFSIAARVRTNELGVLGAVLSSAPNVPDNTGYQLSRLSGNQWRAIVGDGVDWFFVTQDGNFVADTWYDLVMTLDSGTVSLYLDGVKQSGTATGATLAYDTAPVGSGPYFTNLPGSNSAQLDSEYINIYSTALDQAGVDAVRAGTHDGTGLISQWNYDDGSGITLSDSVASNNGTITAVDMNAFWNDNGGGDRALIPGEITNTYTVLAGDVGLYLSCDVVADGSVPASSNNLLAYLGVPINVGYPFLTVEPV